MHIVPQAGRARVHGRAGSVGKLLPPAPSSVPIWYWTHRGRARVLLLLQIFPCGGERGSLLSPLRSAFNGLCHTPHSHCARHRMLAAFLNSHQGHRPCCLQQWALSWALTLREPLLPLPKTPWPRPSGVVVGVWGATQQVALLWSLLLKCIIHF